MNFKLNIFSPQEMVYLSAYEIFDMHSIYLVPISATLISVDALGWTGMHSKIWAEYSETGGFLW